MLSTNLKQLKKCCSNCKNYNGNFCKTFTASTQPDPDKFTCSYFDRNTPLIVTGITLGIDCISTLCNKATDYLNKKCNEYTVKPEDIKEK